MKKLHARLAIFGSVCALVFSIGAMNFISAQEEEFVFDTAPTMDNWSTGPNIARRA